MEQEIRSSSGVLLGKIADTMDKRYAYDRFGMYLGYYDKHNDTTYDKNGKAVALGDALVGLILRNG